MSTRVIAYAWVSPATAIGLVVALLACVRGSIRVRAGVVEAEGPALAWCLRTLVPIRGGAAAITIGHVVIGQDREALASTRAHERVHVAQFERWGVFFLPAYAAASLWAAASGRHFYLDNRFEREARALERGVTESASRWSQSSRHGYGR